MKKVINITIGQTIFLIEDDAYQKLKSYLNEIREYFNSKEDGDGVVDDIENSIAEKLLTKNKDEKNSINLNDVEEIVSELGTVEDLSNDEGFARSENPEEESGKKRLYRDTEDVIVAGVASGIAKYFSIDPVIVRVIFFASLFFGGFGAIAYFVLWIAVQPADTASKKIHMSGGKATISEIENFVKEKVNKVPKSKLKKILTFPFVIIKKIFEFLKRILSKTGPILSSIIGVIIVLTMIASIIGFSTSYIALITGGGIADPVLSGILGYVSGGLFGVFVLISLYLLVTIPILVLIFLGISIIKRKKVLGWMGFTIFAVAWFAALSVVAGGSIGHIEEIKTEINKAEEIARLDFETKTYNDFVFDSVEFAGNADIQIVKGDEYIVEIQAPKERLEQFKINDKNDVLTIDRYGAFNFCLFYCKDMLSKTLIKITTPEIVGLDFSGNATGEMEEFEVDEFNFEVSGGAKFTVRIISNSTNIDSSGSSNLIFEGKTNKFDLDLSGSAKINAYNFIANEANVETSGSAKVDLNVVDVLNVNTSGSAKVSFIDSGNTQVFQDISGSGTVTEHVVEISDDNLEEEE